MKRIAYLLVSIICQSLSAQQMNLTLDIKGGTSSDSITISWGANNKSMNPLIMNKGLNDPSVIQIPLNEPRLIVVGLKGYQGTYELLASPNEEITISGRIRKEDMKESPEVFFSRLHVKGAKHQDKYQNILKQYQFFTDSLDNKVFNEYKDVNRLIENAKKSKNEQVIADMYQTIHGQSYIDRVMGTYMERQEYMFSLVKKQSNNFMGPLLLLRFVGRLNKEHRPYYDMLSDEAKQSYYGREVKDEVYPPTLIGDIAPSVKLKTVDGKDKVLSSTKSNAKFTLLDFWASWCGPCRREIPNLKRIYEKYHEKGLDIIGISADHDVDEWKEAMTEEDLPWENYIDQSRQATSEYKVQYIPSIFIIDGEGKIIAEKLRGKELSDLLEKLFENN